MKEIQRFQMIAKPPAYPWQSPAVVHQEHWNGEWVTSDIQHLILK